MGVKEVDCSAVITRVAERPPAPAGRVGLQKKVAESVSEMMKLMIKLGVEAEGVCVETCRQREEEEAEERNVRVSSAGFSDRRLFDLSDVDRRLTQVSVIYECSVFLVIFRRSSLFCSV